MVICGDEASEYDEHQYCRCKEGESLSYIESEHDNGKEDRTWKFKCQKIPGGNVSSEAKQSGYSSFLSPQLFDVQSGKCF